MEKIKVSKKSLQALRNKVIAFQSYIAYLYDEDDDRVEEIQNTINLIDEHMS